MKQEHLDSIEYYTSEAKGIAWDTCHKIYILMDDEQMRLMKSYDYDPLISSEQMSGDEMAQTVISWFENSCSLRFINAVETTPNANEGFITIIGQFEDEDEDEELCDSCGQEPIYWCGICEDCYNEEAGRQRQEQEDEYPTDEMLQDDEAQVFGNLT